MLSQKTALAIFLSTIFLLIAFAVFYQFKIIKLSKRVKVDNSSQPFFINTPKPTPSVTDIPLEQAIGQVLMTSISGLSLSEEEKVAFREGKLNNILLMGKNIKDEQQLKTLINSIYQEATFSGIKPFIAVDQEGGRVSRIPWVEKTAQSEIKTSEEAYRIAWLRGQQLKALGINMNLSPVIESLGNDYNFIKDQGRAFASNSAELASASIKGYKQAGVIAAVKHYPAALSHTKQDPHEILPIIKISEEEFLTDLLPFNGLDTQAIMVTHLLYPKYDASPSSASELFVNQLLRQDLEFAGMIISDDLSMRAIKDNYQVSEYALGALQSGCDLLIISAEKDFGSVYNYLLDYCINENSSCKKWLEPSLKRQKTLKLYIN